MRTISLEKVLQTSSCSVFRSAVFVVCVFLLFSGRAKRNFQNSAQASGQGGVEPLYADWTPDHSCRHEPHSFTCTPSGKSWPHRTPLNPCQGLVDKKVLFVGDSFAQYAHNAFIVWLSGNYKDGAMQASHDEECIGEYQFGENVSCRYQEISATGKEHFFCNGRTAVKFVGYAHGGNYPGFFNQTLRDYDLIVYSIGRHPYDGNYDERSGVNDAESLYHNAFLNSCKDTNATEMCEKVVWLDTHVRISALYTDEKYDKQIRFHIESPTWVFRGCGIRRVASVWDATELLVTQHPVDAHEMSWDKVHYGLAINLLKAHEIFNEWAKKVQCADANQSFVYNHAKHIEVEQGRLESYD
ncbi:uncharacterized protein MICPUCDRAFT_54883 [Micromonas pusilla CCMP1545]|uniref:Predicted protein n=1 Tax=Micromonas pusilla (strain CCMP1545) TaxID=564608 RepID=C1NAF5_MICPC|nr:uncharacterized protein MICPUCDRAFT_54883 [Micromonas pusilla CCMP1545]EEH50933.1 predicted protein [Micromonas pusilla CCMP1545]|eukprot:XP_003064953.1 predicted protein [Micromonas pusilla CCMP1545]